MININNILANSKNYIFYAHTKEEDVIKETLEDHSSLCFEYFNKIIDNKNLKIIYKNIMKRVNIQDVDLFNKMLDCIFLLHDIGKVNPLFQKNKMNNELKDVSQTMKQINNSYHSSISSIYYINYFIKDILQIKDFGERNRFLYLMLQNAYIISKHHSGLDSFDKFINKIECIKNEETNKYILSNEVKGSMLVLNEMIDCDTAYLANVFSKNQFFKMIKKHIDTLSEDNIVGGCNYVYTRLTLSLLNAADYYSTNEFKNEEYNKNDFGVIKDPNLFYDDYKNGEIHGMIRDYEQKSYGKIDCDNVDNINVLRNEIFLDAERELVKNIDKNIFYLAAPTGSGKSNISNNLVFKILQMDKNKNQIMFVCPFNALVEQSYDNFKNIYKDNPDVLNNMAVINSLYPIKQLGEESYNDSYLNRQFLNYPMLLTTHISLFSIMFGSSKTDVFPFFHLANSVIVLDEIQSYKNIIWSEIIEFLQIFADILNISFIVMSATLPDLNMLIDKNLYNSEVLIKNKDKYFKNKIFKNRVKVNTDLLKSTDVENDMFKLIDKHRGKKILIEFITKKSATEYYKYLCDLKDIGGLKCKHLFLLTGDDNLYEKARVINKVKNEEDVILVATQLIEAGVDIDMDIGFKNISIFDSEEQFLGRINRSCKKENCICYFFCLDDPTKIYRGDIRVQNDLLLHNSMMQDCLKSKDFDSVFSKVLTRLKKLKDSYDIKNSKKLFFKNYVNRLNFENVDKKMKLIENRVEYNIFLSQKITIDNKVLNGEIVWNKYKSLLKDNKMGIAEKKIELSKIQADMNIFMYKINSKEYKELNYNDNIGDILKIDNGERYFINNKFDRSKISNNSLFI